jgi:hypothetical protein
MIGTDFKLLMKPVSYKEGPFFIFTGLGALFDNYFIVGAESSTRGQSYGDKSPYYLGYLRKYSLVRNDSLFSFLE